VLMHSSARSRMLRNTSERIKADSIGMGGSAVHRLRISIEFRVAIGVGSDGKEACLIRRAGNSESVDIGSSGIEVSKFSVSVVWRRVKASIPPIPLSFIDELLEITFVVIAKLLECCRDRRKMIAISCPPVREEKC